MSRPSPRRRALSDRERRALAKRRGTHRSAPRRRLGMLVGALAITLAVAAAAVGLLPKGHGAVTAVADTELATIETAQIAPVTAPVKVASTTSLATTAQNVARSAESRATDTAIPDGSGTGRRIVFSQTDQRVWLVDADGSIERTYLVSGSRLDNLHPGTYAVQLKQVNATAYDYSSTMKYFVQFTRGQNAAIGFHSVPVGRDGKLEETKAQLGTPLSAGCVRQWLPDAIALWNFAPIGTKVVVVA